MKCSALSNVPASSGCCSISGSWTSVGEGSEAMAAAFGASASAIA